MHIIFLRTRLDTGSVGILPLVVLVPSMQWILPYCFITPLLSLVLDPIPFNQKLRLRETGCPLLTVISLSHCKLEHTLWLLVLMGLLIGVWIHWCGLTLLLGLRFLNHLSLLSEIITLRLAHTVSIQNIPVWYPLWEEMLVLLWVGQKYCYLFPFNMFQRICIICWQLVVDRKWDPKHGACDCVFCRWIYDAWFYLEGLANICVGRHCILQSKCDCVSLNLHLPQ